jgi:hypothetical protein
MNPIRISKIRWSIQPPPQPNASTVNQHACIFNENAGRDRPAGAWRQVDNPTHRKAEKYSTIAWSAAGCARCGDVTRGTASRGGGCTARPDWPPSTAHQRAARGRADRPPARRPLRAAGRPRRDSAARLPAGRSGGAARAAFADRARPDARPRRRPAAVSVLGGVRARAERLNARMGADLFKSDEWLGDAIAFAGERE